MRAAVKMQQKDAGLQAATDGEFRRASWHRHFIYQLGGIEQVASDIVVEFQREDSTIAEGLAVTTHMCRGDFRSSWVAEGGCDFVAEALFGELDVDGFLLEDNHARSGGFESAKLELTVGAAAGVWG